MTPDQCSQAADTALESYLEAVGADDSTKIRQALTMLASKCAMGIAMIAGPAQAEKAMSNSAANARRFVEQQP